jgi:cyclopropane-fatty-acyl-phospholipid synthase
MNLIPGSALDQALVPGSLQLLERLLADYPKGNFQIRLWDGSTWGPDHDLRFTLVVKHPEALAKMIKSPNELTLGEAYIFDDLDIEGDIVAAFELADYLLDQEHKCVVPRGVHLASLLRKVATDQQAHQRRQGAGLPGLVHSKQRDSQAVRYHYDLPPEFFALWLDRRMVYSCAYFASREDDLDTAQYNKLDYICRKLRLRRGDRLLDIGCGWGGLVIHAALEYGARARGITLSTRQAEVTRRRIRDAGIEERCSVDISDYRDLGPNLQYDKLVSVGMFEHVGEAMLAEYFGRAWQLLRPGGEFLNSGIAIPEDRKPSGPSFINRYVFPDGELVPLNATLGAAEKSGFEVRDVESLREHYALTLEHWVRRLETHAEEARRITNDTVYRIWRLYMAGSGHRFCRGQLNLYQTLMAKPLNGPSVPRTRADWYWR